MGTYVPVYGFENELTANCVRHTVAQQDPLFKWGNLGVWHSTYKLDSDTPLSDQGVERTQTVFVREICERDV
eukprot:10932392-Alexandrium_andersonii.AAC.1